MQKMMRNIKDTEKDAIESKMQKMMRKNQRCKIGRERNKYAEKTRQKQRCQKGCERIKDAKQDAKESKMQKKDTNSKLIPLIQATEPHTSQVYPNLYLFMLRQFQYVKYHEYLKHQEENIF